MSNSIGSEKDREIWDKFPMMKEIEALRSENERLKGERDSYRTALEEISLKGNSLREERKIALKAIAKYPNPTT